MFNEQNIFKRIARLARGKILEIKNKPLGHVERRNIDTDSLQIPEKKDAVAEKTENARSLEQTKSSESSARENSPSKNIELGTTFENISKINDVSVRSIPKQPFDLGPTDNTVGK